MEVFFFFTVDFIFQFIVGLECFVHILNSNSQGICFILLFHRDLNPPVLTLSGRQATLVAFAIFYKKRQATKVACNKRRGFFAVLSRCIPKLVW